MPVFRFHRWCLFGVSFAASSRYPIGFLWIPLARTFPEMCYMYVSFMCLFLSSSIPFQWARNCRPMSEELLHSFAMCWAWIAYICFVVLLLIALTPPWFPQGVPCDPYASLLGSCVFHEDCLLIPCWSPLGVLLIAFKHAVTLICISYVFSYGIRIDSLGNPYGIARDSM